MNDNIKQSKWVKVKRKSLVVFIDHFKSFCGDKGFFLKQTSMSRRKLVLIERLVMTDIINRLPESMPKNVKAAIEDLKVDLEKD